MSASIPIVDFTGVREGDERARERAAGEVAAACRDFGFFYITNHGIPAEAIDGALAAAKEFFAQDKEVKDQVAAVDHRGYVAEGKAQMKGAAKSDLKESFILGWELEADDPDLGKPLRSLNQWPDTPRHFRDSISWYFSEVGACGEALLSVVAKSLGIDEDFFSSLYSKPLQRTNVIHYPPSTQDPEVFGVGEHTDYGAITLLWQDQVGGLQVRDRTTNEWIAAPPVPGSLVVNVGDLLERWSNGRLASTMHRVINESGAERYSIATFFDPSYDAVADPVDLGITREEAQYPPIICGDYILGRIRESFDYREKA